MSYCFFLVFNRSRASSTRTRPTSIHVGWRVKEIFFCPRIEVKNDDTTGQTSAVRRPQGLLKGHSEGDNWTLMFHPLSCRQVSHNQRVSIDQATDLRLQAVIKQLRKRHQLESHFRIRKFQLSFLCEKQPNLGSDIGKIKLQKMVGNLFDKLQKST